MLISPTKMSSNQQLATKQSSDVSSTASDAYKTTTETVSSVGANLAGAFSGALSVGGQASSKRTTTTTSGGNQISQAPADQQYLERMEDEYAKREGGA
jgi:hypothetical protein